MLRKLLNLFIPTRKPTLAPKRRQPVRLGFEILEARAVPAQLIWTGGAADGLWGTAANWTDPVGGPSVVPGSGDYAIFRNPGGGLPGASTPCSTAGLAIIAVDRVIMEQTYTSTLTIANGTTLGTNNYFTQYGYLEMNGTGTINAGTYFNINGEVFTSGSNAVSANLATTGSFFLNGGLLASGGAAGLIVTSGGFDGAGPIAIGSGSLAGSMRINGPFTHQPFEHLEVLNGSALVFDDAGLSAAQPIIKGTVDLRGTMTSDTIIKLDGATVNSLGLNFINGDMAVYNSGTINVGASALLTSALVMATGSLTVGAPSPSGSATGATLNLNTGSSLQFPGAPLVTSTFTITSQGVVNMYGASIVMDVARVAALDIQRAPDTDPPGQLPSGILNTFGGSGLFANDTIVGNVYNNGKVQFVGAALHALNLNAVSGAGGNYTQGSYGTLAMRLNNGLNNRDLLNVNGTGVLAGKLSLTGVAALNPGQTWTIISTGVGLTGDFGVTEWPDGSPLWDGLIPDGASYVVNNA